MCGISAIVGDVSQKEEKLKISLSKITHRGDHEFEYRIFDEAALGVNRLAIVDEKYGNQPQYNENETVFAILNGEIFNFAKLTDELVAHGHEFRSSSDTEVLVHLWEEYKAGLVSKLDSEMFAFIIFDKATGEVFVARDRIGVKPLYYAKDKGGSMYFASEIKALVCFDEIDNIHEFPAGSYYYQGKFIKYYDVAIGENTNTLDILKLKDIIERAVFKRVQTELPIAVFLSGGVDSSLIMELATRFHKDVTALILGMTDSPDYVSAIKLCKEKGWQYKAIEPSIDYEKELSDIIYYVESYDPNIVRHSFANDAISRLAHELAFKVVLTGEGADEIFAGYNEFLEIDESKINAGCRALLNSMSRGNLMRVDKMAMRYTVETRCPYFDQELVDAAMSIAGSLKVGMYQDKKITKLVFRNIAAKYLPKEIAFRDKAPFANGAGMNIGVNYQRGDGVLSEIAEKFVSNDDFAKIKNEFMGRGFQTKEEVLLFDKYRQFGYDKFVEGRAKLMVKDTLTSL